MVDGAPAKAVKEAVAKDDAEAMVAEAEGSRRYRRAEVILAFPKSRFRFCETGFFMPKRA